MIELNCPKCGGKRIQQVQDGATVFNDVSVHPGGEICYDLYTVVLGDTSIVTYICADCGTECDLEDFLVGANGICTNCMSKRMTHSPR